MITSLNKRVCVATWCTNNEDPYEAKIIHFLVLSKDGTRWQWNGKAYSMDHVHWEKKW
jgi:hypothetical protein